MSNTRLNKITFKTRLFLSVGTVFLLLALLVCFLFSMTSITNTIANDQSSSDMVLERISTQVNTLYEQMNIAATSITKNPTLRSTIQMLNTDDPELTQQYLYKIQQERGIRTTLGNMMFSPIISNVILYNKENSYFYYSGTYYDDMDYIYDRLSEDTSYEKFQSTTVLYEPPHQNPWTTDSRMVLSVLRNFQDAATTEHTIVEIQVPCRLLDEICTQSSFQDEKEIMILDSEGTMVYPYDQDILVLEDEPLDQIKEEIAQGKTRSSSYYYSYCALSIESTNLTVVLLSNNQNIQRQILTYIATTVIVSLGTLGISLLIIFILISKVTLPLNRLISHVNELTLDNDTKLMLPEDSFDEFEILSTSMNQMVDKLKASIQEIYELQIRESNANLAALQAQVNPHFLYNALNSISAASEVYDSEITTEMCQELSSMMRYVTSKQTEVCLIEEISHTRNYLDFMKISNGSNFDYHIELPQELHGIKIPKLSIQPFAENSFRHGFKKTMPPWNLSITCTTRDSHWQIIIRDNGGGFSPEALSAITQTPMEANNLEISGLGLNNTFSRLSLYFGERFTYRVENLTVGCQIILEGEEQPFTNKGETL